MKNIIKYLFILTALNCSLLAQSSHAKKDSSGVIKVRKQETNNAQQTIQPTTNQISTTTNQMPEFPGGTKELYTFIIKNLQYPDTAKKTSTSGTVYTSFLVSFDGKIKDAKILKGVGGPAGKYLDEEALRIVGIMPNWNPGIQNGLPVNVQFNLPIKFKLN